MRLLLTFPGRAGDIFWTLPVARALAEVHGPVDLCIAGEFAGLVPVLEQQPYLKHVWADPTWTMAQPDTWYSPVARTLATPPVLPPSVIWDRVVDLGYRGWPDLPLPYYTYQTLRREYPDLPVGELELGRQWITVPAAHWKTYPVIAGWSDCYFELKVGLIELLRLYPPTNRHGGFILTPKGSRWHTEYHQAPTDWMIAAQLIATATVFLGDCSALHVLAVAMGKPVVIYEPMQARLDPIFWPLGKDGPQVTLVRGNDGEMTTDSRHTAETLAKILETAR